MVQAAQRHAHAQEKERDTERLPAPLRVYLNSLNSDYTRKSYKIYLDKYWASMSSGQVMVMSLYMSPV